MKNKQPNTIKAWAFAWVAGASSGIETDPSRQSIAGMRKATRVNKQFRVGKVVRIEVPAPKEEKP